MFHSYQTYLIHSLNCNLAARDLPIVMVFEMNKNK